MIVITTWGPKSPTRSEELQLKAMFEGLVMKYQDCLLTMADNLTPEEMAECEEEAHETRTIALQVSAVLKMDIKDAQEALRPTGSIYE